MSTELSDRLSLPYGELEDLNLKAKEQRKNRTPLHQLQEPPALDLARLPVPSRPQHWRSLLTEAREDMPASFVTDETAAADHLLGG